MSKERRLELRADDDFLSLLDEVVGHYGFDSRSKVLRRLVADAHRSIHGLEPLGPSRVRRRLPEVDAGRTVASDGSLSTDEILARSGPLGDVCFGEDTHTDRTADPNFGLSTDEILVRAGVLGDVRFGEDIP
jgi:hypothetical protein